MWRLWQDLLFPQRPILTAHIKKTHPDPKAVSFHCAYCAQQFRSNTSMAGHVNKNTGEKVPKSAIIFMCNICGKEFGMNPSLMANLSTTHTDKEKKIYKYGFVCQIRSKKKGGEWRSSERSVHYKMVHLAEFMFNISLPSLLEISFSSFFTKSLDFCTYRLLRQLQ